MTEQTTKEFLDMEEVAAYIGVSMATVYRYVRSTENPLPSFKLSSKKILVSKEELDTWIKTFRNTNLEGEL